TEAVIATAKKTHRVIVVHEAVQFGGFGGEIVSTIADSDAFYYLDAPIKRVGGLFCPVPFNPVLEAESFPTPAKIEAAIREIL
ncbi:MAG: alpha-ketoacid dehydrogenase subunit beta, partial [Firmicutes bacterium]|nr:alpha-ketoacid dehydrogenase subunit beta [Bacillota bacterium]